MARGNVASKAAATVAARKIQAIELRRRGYSYREIGKRLGVSHTQAASDVRECLAELAQERQAETENYVTLELERLDGLLRGIIDKAEQGDLHAIDRVLKIEERRAKLLGLDAPARAEISGADGAPLQVAITAIDYRAVLAPLAPDEDDE